MRPGPQGELQDGDHHDPQVDPPEELQPGPQGDLPRVQVQPQEGEEASCEAVVLQALRPQEPLIQAGPHAVLQLEHTGHRQ